MTRITHPATTHYFNSQPSTPNQPHPPGPHALKQQHTLLNAPDVTLNAAQPRQQPPEAAPFHPYHPQASLTPADPHPAASLERQGRQAALALLAEGRLSKAPLGAALAEHADTPEALAGFFTTLGPQNTLEALLCLDPHGRDIIGPSGYAPVVDPALRQLWVGKGHLQTLHRLDAQQRDLHRAQRERVATALSNAVTGGLSETFLQELAAAASATPRAANALSQILIQSDDPALLPLKTALFNTLMTLQKALKPVRDDDPQKQLSITDQRGWVRAATLLLSDDASAQWLARLQGKVGSAGLSQFIATAVEETVAIRGLDGATYADEDYQQGLAELLRGLSRLEGQAYTTLKAHVFSAATDAMGEVYTRATLTEGLKVVFVSDPKGVAMEISNTSNDAIQSPTAFSFFFKEAIFNNPDPNNTFIEAISSTLKELYQDATNSALSEANNENSAIALGVVFGSLRAAFEGAKADHQTDQDAVRNMANAFTGLATFFPHIRTPLSAAKDGVVVPIFDAVLNFSNRAQAENMNLIDNTFNKLLGAMVAGFNDYKERTGLNMRGIFNYERTAAERDGANKLEKS